MPCGAQACSGKSRTADLPVSRKSARTRPILKQAGPIPSAHQAAVDDEYIDIVNASMMQSDHHTQIPRPRARSLKAICFIPVPDCSFPIFSYCLSVHPDECLPVDDTLISPYPLVMQLLIKGQSVYLQLVASGSHETTAMLQSLPQNRFRT